MQIVHRISLNADAADRRDLSQRGIVIPEGLATFELDEADPRWPALEPEVARRRWVDVVSTRFTDAEVDAAAWVQVVPTWHRGYPQPEDGWREATYDLTRRCAACGVGAVRKAPFRMKGEPRWGRNALLQVNWAFDAYFATPDLHREVFEPRGVRARAVLGRSGARELASVVELAVEEPVGLRTAPPTGAACPVCGRTKYLPHVRGPFPALAGVPGGHWAWTDAWFGSGASAHHAVIASRELVRALVKHGARGVAFVPVAS